MEPQGLTTQNSAPLNAESFVFLDERPWPYMVRQMQNGDWWLYYWADSYKNFVTLRKLTVEEIERFKPLALPPEKAALYTQGNKI